MIDNDAKARWAAWMARQQPARPRKREYVYMAVALVLAIFLLLNITERTERAAPQVSSSLASPSPAAAARLHEVVTACLNGKHVIKVGQEVVARCEPVKKP
jgi:hypothetical protein